MYTNKQYKKEADETYFYIRRTQLGPCSGEQWAHMKTHTEQYWVSQGDLENRTVFAFVILQQQNKTNQISVAPEMYICLIGSINK